jgi:hypothetical protein
VARAAGTAVELAHAHVIRARHGLERTARMAHLTAGPPSGTGPQRLGLGRGFGQSVGGGRFAAIGAIEGQAPLERFDLALQRPHAALEGAQSAAQAPDRGFQTQDQRHEFAQGGTAQLEELLPSAQPHSCARNCESNG